MRTFFSELFEVNLILSNIEMAIKTHKFSPLDEDECAVADDNDCDDNAECFNIVGSYRCQCNEGNTHIWIIQLGIMSQFIMAFKFQTSFKTITLACVKKKNLLCDI